MKTDKGYLVISLDFELLWGIFDVVDFSAKKEYFLNTRKVIPEILELFDRYDIHCTWAVVGMLFHENWESWERSIPSEIPTYKQNRLSPYLFAEKNKGAIPGEMCFAPELIRLIQSTSNQEIASHTYSHYYCEEEGQTPDQFKKDLEQAVKLADSWGIKLNSLVFPRNQYRNEYLKLCSDLGIHSVRSNPEVWYWEKPNSEDLLTRLCRTGDAYNLLGKKKSYKLQVGENKTLVPQKASRFFRPFQQNSLLNSLKLKRIKSEMLHAAKEQEIYHLWWHPHNFGENPERSLRDLEEILSYYKLCNKKYSFGSATMGELGELMRENK